MGCMASWSPLMSSWLLTSFVMALCDQFRGWFSSLSTMACPTWNYFGLTSIELDTVQVTKSHTFPLTAKATCSTQHVPRAPRPFCPPHRPACQERGLL